MDTSVGIGQVRMSTAEFLENQNYVSKASANEGGWMFLLLDLYMEQNVWQDIKD